jgi:transcriptional regulator with XRE-family HTH domain
MERRCNMRTPRKTPFVLAVNLRELRKQGAVTVEQAADMMQVCDSKYVLAIEAGSRQLTLERAARAAYGYAAPVIAEVEGVGMISIQRADTPQTIVNVFSPGEEAWETLREQRESIEVLPRLQNALLRGDRVELVGIYRECVLEPLRAAQRLQTALDARDPTLRVDAHVQEAQEAAGFESTLKHRKPGGVHRVACAI